MHTRPYAHCRLHCNAVQQRDLCMLLQLGKMMMKPKVLISHIRPSPAQPHTIHTCACHRPQTPMQCSAFPLQQHNTLCSSKPLAKYFFLNLFVMMQLNWKLKAISFIFHSQQETYFFFSFHLPFIYLYMCISLTYILSFYLNSPCTRCCSSLTRQTQQTWPTWRPQR